MSHCDCDRDGDHDCDGDGDRDGDRDSDFDCVRHVSLHLVSIDWLQCVECKLKCGA